MFWQNFWEENNVYKSDLGDASKPLFSVDTPPPTVSGKLHIGHIFSYSQAEVLVRYKRMNGFRIYYPFGFDTNGMPTERLVEKDLNIKAHELPRKEFFAKCLDVVDGYIDEFKKLWRSVGFSADLNNCYSSIQPEIQKTSQARFLEMVEEWKIYKKKFPALWSTTFQTSIAQAEVEDKEFDSVFYDLEFSLENGNKLVIATTRPELLPACVAVFVNPEDEKYSGLIGSKVKTALWVEVPLLADEKVQMWKWTWAVMCCTYGDETDMFWVQKYDLPEKIILNKYWKIEESWIDWLDWLKVKEARAKIIEILKESGKVLKEQPIVHAVWTHERDWSPVEIIPVNQWFVNILSIKNKIIEQWEKMNWKPDFMFKRFKDWTENLHWDWCISRNRYYWIPIPCWYSKKTGEIIYASKEQLPVDPYTDLPLNMPKNHTAEDLEPERDVFDTWFTSGQTPEINQELAVKKWLKGSLLPMSLRPHAHDIIRTWTFYTVVHSWLKRKDIPFVDVMVSGHVLAKQWEKISKSKWNAKFTPESLVEQYGADSVRYRACGGQLWKNIAFDEWELKNWIKLVTKLRNSFQFVKMQLADVDISVIRQFAIDYLQPTDKRIIARLQNTIKSVTKHLENYEFGLAKIAFEEFFWADFCDTYLEMVKMRLYKPELFQDWEMKKKSGQWTVFHTYYQIIQLISPYLPHITEEIYQDYFRQYFDEISIHISSFPKETIHFWNEDEMFLQFAWIKDLIESVRRYKTEKQISLWAELSKIVITWTQELLDSVEVYKDDLKWVTKTDFIELHLWEKTNLSFQEK